MGRCGRERAPCESVVAYRRWCLSQVHGGQASTHGCCGRLALSIPRTPDVSHRHPGKPRLIPSACPSRFRYRRDGWPRTSRDALRRAVANPKGRVRCPCYSLVNSGNCLTSAESQTHRIHSDGMMKFGPDSTAQRKPSRPDTSIAFSRPSSESRNASSSSISEQSEGMVLLDQQYQILGRTFLRKVTVRWCYGFIGVQAKWW